jgi:hypothetical protein
LDHHCPIAITILKRGYLTFKKYPYFKDIS